MPIRRGRRLGPGIAPQGFAVAGNRERVGLAVEDSDRVTGLARFDRRLGKHAGEEGRAASRVDRLADLLRELRAFALPHVVVELPDDAEVLRMVGDDQEIQGRLDLHTGAVVGVHDRQPLRPAIGRVRIGAAIAVQERVERI